MVLNSDTEKTVKKSKNIATVCELVSPGPNSARPDDQNNHVQNLRDAITKNDSALRIAEAWSHIQMDSIERMSAVGQDLDESKEIFFTDHARSLNLFGRAGWMVKIERDRMALLNQAGDGILRSLCVVQRLMPEISANVNRSAQESLLDNMEEGKKYYIMGLYAHAMEKSEIFGTSMPGMEKVAAGIRERDAWAAKAFPDWIPLTKPQHKGKQQVPKIHENAPDSEK